MTHSYRSHVYALAIATAALCQCYTSVALADGKESVETKIARAVTAAPADISDDATVVDVDGTVLRTGSNGWTCIPGVPIIPGDAHPMCNDVVWMNWISAAQAGIDFSTDVIGISYMLAGDGLLNNADPAATDPSDGGMWVEEGPHLMMLGPASVLANLPRDPTKGGPYVMFDNSSVVHVMVPINSKILKEGILVPAQ